MSESTNPVHSRSFRRASLRSELTFLSDRGRGFKHIIACFLLKNSFPFSSFDFQSIDASCVPKAASCVGQGGLPLQMAWFAAFLSFVSPSLPAGVRNDHFVGKGVQGVVHNLHLY